MPLVVYTGTDITQTLHWAWCLSVAKEENRARCWVALLAWAGD